jgi:actin-related protein
MAGDNDGNWEMTSPIDPVTGLHYDNDWAELVPTFLRHGYDKSLGLKDQKEYPLMLVERSYNPPPLRQQMLEILMEECEVPATFFGRDATLACYACGRTTSVVVDIGYHGTTVTPVFEGYVEQKGIRRSPIGTLAMDELALEQLQNLCKANRTELKPIYQVRNPKWEMRKGPFQRLALLQIARECRESGAGQSINTAASKTLLVPSISYTLPDGTNVDIPSQNRFAVADLILGAKVEDETAPKPREEALEVLTKQYHNILEGLNKLDEDDEEQNGEDDMDVDEKKSQAEKYTEATAVGLSSRRATRGSKKTATESPTKAQKGDSRKVPFDERILHRACSSYFTNHLEYLTSLPVANMVCDAAYRCDRDQQATMLGNVVLCGGGACIGPTDQAAPDLLREQIESIIHTHTPGWRVKMLSPSTQERVICSWLGGSILASLGIFHEMWITKAEYEEWGSAIVNRKCP